MRKTLPARPCKSYQPSQLRFAALLVTALTCLEGQAQQPPPSAAAQARSQFSGALKALREIEGRLKSAEAESSQADDQAGLMDAADLPAVQQRVSDAIRKGERVRDLQAELTLAKERLADARQRLSAALEVASARVAWQAPGGGPVDGVANLVDKGAKAQAGVAALNANSKEAFKVTDEARAIALGLARDAIKAGGPPGSEASQKALQTIKDAQQAHEEALSVYKMRYGAQALGNELSGAALELARCSIENCTDRDRLMTETNRASQAMDEKKKESKEKLTAAKLLSFGIRASEVSKSAAEQQAALEFLQFIDRNPNAGWKFGGEATTLSAGAEGATAAIRVSLQRFVNTWARDTSITLSSPVAKGSDSTALLASNGSYRPDETKLRYEVAGVRQLGNGKGDFVRFNQVAYFAQVSRLRFRVGNPAAAGDPSQYSRTAWSLGASSLFAQAEDSAVHRVGFAVERGYDAGRQSTRCKVAPDPIVDPATGNPTGVNEAFLRCMTAFFSPVKVAWSRTLDYRYRREWERVAIAPAFSYEHATKTKTYELPVYLVRGEGDNADKFTAGVAYRHTSKPGEPADKRWELFVSSPLSLLSP